MVEPPARISSSTTTPTHVSHCLNPRNATPNSHQCADQAYKAGSYERAHELYSEAIGMVDGQDTDETKACLFANRAAALTNLGRNADALRDCEQVRFLSLVRPSTSPPGVQAPREGPRASRAVPPTGVRLFVTIALLLRPPSCLTLEGHHVVNFVFGACSLTGVQSVRARRLVFPPFGLEFGTSVSEG